MKRTLEALTLDAIFAHTSVGDPNECWIWQGPAFKKGALSLMFKRKRYPIQPMVFALANSIVLPKYAHIRSLCDNRLCLNPNHLYRVAWEDKDLPFDSYIEPCPASGCFLWTGPTTVQGYGRVRSNGRKYRAHRLAWEKEKGPIPDGLHVLHICNTPSCVRVDHLELGTTQDNNSYMAECGRSTRGERSVNAKLCEADVLAIRRQRGTPYEQLAGNYGVSVRCIRDVFSGRTWKHV